MDEPTQRRPGSQWWGVSGGVCCLAALLVAVDCWARFSSDFSFKERYRLCQTLVFAPQPETYRLLTYAVTHETLGHLLTNLLLLAVVGHRAETSLGTAAFLCVTTVAAIVVGGLTVALAYTSSLFDILALDTCVIGASGVLFTHIYLVSVFEARQWTIRRCFTVKSKYIPWVLLVCLQAVASTMSFLCHLSGVLVGILYERRLLGVFLPSYAMFEACSAWRVSKLVEKSPLYIPLPPPSAVLSILSCRLFAPDPRSFTLVPSSDLRETELAEI